MPTLIDEGKVFIAESPLYEINHKGQTWFAYTEKEKAAVLAELGDCAPSRISSAPRALVKMTRI